jgi:hypothetical protein
MRPLVVEFFEKILFATDFSRAAASTLPFAAEIAFKGAGPTHEPSPINLNDLTRSEFSRSSAGTNPLSRHQLLPLSDSPRKKSGLRLIYSTPNHPLASLRL